MKQSTKALTVRCAIIVLALFAGLFCEFPSTAQGQIFVTNYNGSHFIESQPIDEPGNNGTIGEYRLDGSAVNPVLVSGLNGPRGIALAEDKLFVANYFGGTIGRFSTNGADMSNPPFVDGFASAISSNGPNLFVLGGFGTAVGKFTSFGALVDFGSIVGLNAGTTNAIAVSGDGAHIFVANYSNGSISEYDAVTGAIVNAALITGLNLPTSIAVSGNDIFITNSGNGTLGKYHLDGTTVNATFVTGLNNPLDIVELDGNLYVVNNGTSSIGEYDAANGAVINAGLITGLSDPQGIAIVPEPSTFELVLDAAICLALCAWRFKRHARIAGNHSVCASHSTASALLLLSTGLVPVEA